jgi:predicted PhzF superfamily epimerase YddE/YHI9
LFSELGFAETDIRFHSKSGWLSAKRRGEIIELDFPARQPEPCPLAEELIAALGHKPREVLKSRDYLAVYDSEAEVAAHRPDMQRLCSLDGFGMIVTARGNNSDFVSRFFAPKAGIPEDPVTGSAHATLIPFWAKRLGKSEMFARQISRRGGEIHCRQLGERVGIGGRSVTYSKGTIYLT